MPTHLSGRDSSIFTSTMRAGFGLWWYGRRGSISSFAVHVAARRSRRDDGLHLMEPWGAQNGVVNGWFIDDEEFGGLVVPPTWIGRRIVPSLETCSEVNPVREYNERLICFLLIPMRLRVSL
ncbi:unnamed protein product [Microthlaspi erraticum]|uniref:Uncharacterized protein n=1 Tax=Microthlaspi erraticum TaxID=1685480 RepID=A0A6D2HWI8_9BRAS|nr:unnamed protein product [Microthlaspi erraticum]